MSAAHDSDLSSCRDPHNDLVAAAKAQHEAVEAVNRPHTQTPTAGGSAATTESLTLESSGPAFTGPAPDSFAGYQILREVHRGGQGVVYQALQKSTNRKVAIKVMREGPFTGAAD